MFIEIFYRHCSSFEIKINGGNAVWFAIGEHGNGNIAGRYENDIGRHTQKKCTAVAPAYMACAIDKCTQAVSVSVSRRSIERPVAWIANTMGLTHPLQDIGFYKFGFVVQAAIAELQLHPSC